MVKHHIGVIGGSGLYALEGLADVREQHVDTAFGAPADAVVMGTLHDTRLYFLPRHGRGHRVPPHRINFRANVLALKQLGAQQLVSLSAVGSLHPDLHPGDFVLVDQYIDRTRDRANTFFDEEGAVAHVSMADPTDAALSACLARGARAGKATVHEGGTYVCVEGPQFSTRAESNLFRQWGASVVGMTNLPEARLAREAELPYASVAMVTDYDCWHEAEDDVSVEAVIAILNQNVARARTMLSVIQDWPDPRRSPAATALDGALLTAPDSITPKARDKLAPLLNRYLGKTA